MAQIEIDLNEITTVNYNGNALTELAFDTQTVWTRPTVAVGGRYVNAPQVVWSGRTATFEPSVINEGDFFSGSVGTINEMSQDGTIVSYNFRDKIFVLSRPNTSTTRWTLRDIISGYGDDDDAEKSFAMNHDGSYIVTGVGSELKLVSLQVFHWDGDSYELVQTIQPFENILYSGHCEKILFCHTRNAFTIEPSQGAPTIVYGEFSGQFYPLGEVLPVGRALSISDGGIGNTSATYENIQIAFSSGGTTNYSDRTSVYKLQNNNWVLKGVKFGSPSVYNAYIAQTILSQDGNSFVQRGQETTKISGTNRFVTRPKVYAYSFNNESQQYIKRYTVPLPIQGSDSRFEAIAASNDLEHIYGLSSIYVPTDNPLPNAYYRLLVGSATWSADTNGISSYRSSNSFPNGDWEYGTNNYGPAYPTNNKAGFRQVSGGLSCDATGDISSFNLVVDKPIDGNSFKIRFTENTPTYTLTRSRDSIFENAAVTISLSTEGLQNSSVSYTITGIQAADIQEPLTGTFEVVDSSATVTLNSVADSTLEGNQTLTLSLDNGQASIDVDILDTSV